MGQTEVHGAGNDEQRRQFMRTLLRDVDALDRMLREGLIESGVRRIGAEQEVALIDHAGNPAPVAEHILAELDDASFTTELGNFNLEVNLDPLPMRGDSLRVMENQILTRLEQLRTAAARHDTLIALTGILPSIQKSDLSLKNLTDRPRYHELNSALNSLRGGPYELNISGTDELSMSHDSIMVEACNTSFQCALPS